jgi:hypothetical protein
MESSVQTRRQILIQCIRACRKEDRTWLAWLDPYGSYRGLLGKAKERKYEKRVQERTARQHHRSSNIGLQLASQLEAVYSRPIQPLVEGSLDRLPADYIP